MLPAPLKWRRYCYYVNNFGSYNATYGSIGAVIVLLTWMYLSGFFVLVGGEINAEIEHASAAGKDPGEKKPGDASTAEEPHAVAATATHPTPRPLHRAQRPSRRARQTAFATGQTAQIDPARRRLPLRRQTPVPGADGMTVWIGRHPWVALATAAAAGFLVAGRMMPSSKRQSQQESHATFPGDEAPVEVVSIDETA